ncbi:MAG: 30S ribosomal protein S8 [Candidatus Eisenbacteria bacterium]|uniref:Small ribosomal subunit protein uS8 n=1 Tax=Eiseniibacteriota bacterium TaxID=2212470 RepID=A0A849SJJ7_UNCEI|nr:30S ribosomal protein S8 [Candidatus Eisenbacteria bacterium]
MSVSDPVADFLTCVRNAIQAKHRKVDVPSSRLKHQIAEVLLRERFVNNVKLIEDERQRTLRVYLRYGADNVNVISGIRRISSPGRRVYVRKTELPRVLGGLGTSIVSTSKGVMTDREAREAGLGGEVICQVW